MHYSLKNTTQMSLPTSRKTANAVVSHVHFASKTTQFNVSFDKDAGKYVLFCMNNDYKSTCEFHLDEQTRNLVVADLSKLGYVRYYETV